MGSRGRKTIRGIGVAACPVRPKWTTRVDFIKTTMPRARDAPPNGPSRWSRPRTRA